MSIKMEYCLFIGDVHFRNYTGMLLRIVQRRFPTFAGVIQTVEYEDGTQSIEREDYSAEEWEHIGHLWRA